MARGIEALREARLSLGDPALLRLLIERTRECPHLMEDMLTCIDRLAERDLPAGILSPHRDASLIADLLSAYLSVRGELPAHIYRLVSAQPQIGVARFPTATTHHDGVGQIIEIRVERRPDGPSDAADLNPQLKDAVEQARAWVSRQLPQHGAALKGLSWSLSESLYPVAGDSLFVAAAVAWASAALLCPVSPTLAFTGRPLLSADGQPNAVDPTSIPGKAKISSDYGHIEALHTPKRAAWPQDTDHLRVEDILSLGQLMSSLFTGIWSGAPPSPAPAQDPTLHGLRERIRALLNAAPRPLSEGDLHLWMNQIGWGDGLEIGQHRMRALLEPDLACAALDDDRWFLSRATIDGDPAVAPGRAQIVAGAGVQPPPRSLDPDMTPSARAFSKLREAPDRAEISKHLWASDALPLKRLALALKTASAPAPLAESAAALVADAEAPDALLALQATAEIALYLLVSEALRELPPTGVALSLGRLQALLQRAHPERGSAIQAARDLCAQLNAALHHLGGGLTLAEQGADLYGRLLPDVSALVQACCDHPRQPAPEWVDTEHTPPRFGVGGRPQRWRPLHRVERSSAGSCQPLPSVPVNALPFPVAISALQARRHLTAEIPDPRRALGALDILLSAWLRLCVDSPLSRGLLDETHTLQRVTLKALLHAISDGLPWAPSRLEAQSWVYTLGDLRHHPGPFQAASPAHRCVHDLACEIFEALDAAFRDQPWRLCAHIDGADLRYHGLLPSPAPGLNGIHNLWWQDLEGTQRPVCAALIWAERLESTHRCALIMRGNLGRPQKKRRALVIGTDKTKPFQIITL